MLSNSLLNATVCTMSKPNNSATTRKKSAKCSANSSRNSNHKLKRIPSTSTYVVDDEVRENLAAISFEETSVILDARKGVVRTAKGIDKTTSSTTCGGRKVWNWNPKPPEVPSPINGAIEEESELISMLTKQLYLAEAKIQKVESNLKKSEDHLKSKDQELGRLKLKVKEWESKNKSQEVQRKKEQQHRRHEIDHSEYLYRRCLMLEHKIFEMEKFLADYGLIWVGDTSNEKQSENISNNYVETYYEQIIANIDQLNLAAGKDEVHVERNEKGNGGGFKTPPCMILKFYKNGMIVQGSHLRLYDDPTAVSFIRDILDGYFPSELQQTYPNGVPFKVEDHRNELFVGDYRSFPGHGYRLGKQPPVDNVLLSTKPRKFDGTFQRSGRRYSLSKDNVSSAEFSTPSLTARSCKSRGSSETPSMEMYVLRSQILASHNNICSDTHLQSHINAELGLSSRREKRDLATKNTEYDLSGRERMLKSRAATRVPSCGRYQHSSADRTSSRVSPCRLENVGDRARQRSRSASLPGVRPNSKSTPRLKIPMESNSMDPLRPSNHSMEFSASKKSLRARSASQLRKSTPPILHQINEPSGKPGELRLKVRSLNGGTVYLVHVCTDESIARLYQLLDKAMSSSVPRTYKIVLSGYSPRRLEQLGLTLRESGITRDSVLHLVND